jgi:hypothetical protein
VNATLVEYQLSSFGKTKRHSIYYITDLALDGFYPKWRQDCKISRRRKAQTLLEVAKSQQVVGSISFGELKDRRKRMAYTIAENRVK